MAKKAHLVCRPCGTRVVVTDLGAAVVECYECGMELESAAKAAKKPAVKKAVAKRLPAKKAAPKKPAAKKAAAKSKK
jgi:uncharacterized Zn finger protein